MGKHNKDWQKILEEFDREAAFWAQFSLHPSDRAKHFAPWDGFAADASLVASGALGEAKKHYPRMAALVVRYRRPLYDEEGAVLSENLDGVGSGGS